MAELAAQGETLEALFWVGCAGSFDDRTRRIIKAPAYPLQKTEACFAVLGTEESCTGDPAKRVGNEFLFQMQVVMDIEVLNSYQITEIVTTCPHCFNIIKNEHLALGGNYEIIHYTQLLKTLIDEGRLTIETDTFKGKRITSRNPCYLSRANKVCDAPRELLGKLEVDLVEVKRYRSRAMYCGAGGTQMFKEAEKGDKGINVLRIEQALEVRPDIVVTACSFCNMMMTNGIKTKEKETQVKIYDIAELMASENPIL